MTVSCGVLCGLGTVPGTVFKIITAHKTLLSLKKTAADGDPTGRCGFWILELDAYEYIIVHRKGKQHPNADMSRLPNLGTFSKAVQCVLPLPILGLH